MSPSRAVSDPLVPRLYGPEFGGSGSRPLSSRPSGRSRLGATVPGGIPYALSTASPLLPGGGPEQAAASNVMSTITPARHKHPASIILQPFE
jgi:hypothetical protein